MEKKHSQKNTSSEIKTSDKKEQIVVIIMVVNIRKKRELVSRILGVGVNRVRFEPDKLDDVTDSITRENIRILGK